METHRYMLDTNILSELVRQPGGMVFDHLERVLPQTACTSVIVAAEIRYGFAIGASEQIQRQALIILDTMDILPLETPVDTHYGDIRAYLKERGQLIGANDLFIAAHARALGLVLVTANEREFKRVPDLQVENWLG